MSEILFRSAELSEAEVDARFQDVVDQLEGVELSPAHEAEIEKTIFMKVSGRMDDGYSEEAM